MSEPQDDTGTGSDATSSRDAAGLPKDDERENREHVEETGEPATDALGNADGAS